MKFSEGLRKGLAIREKLGRPYCAAVIVAAGSSSRMGGTNKILTVLEKQKLVAEGAGAVGIAAAMYHKVNTEGKTVCALLSGGNVDVTMLERILTRGLAKEGRTVSFSTVLPDQPHALASFLEVVSSMGANVLDVNHERRNTKAAIGSCVVNLSVETRDKAHIQELFGCLRRKGYVVEEQ